QLRSEKRAVSGRPCSRAATLAPASARRLSPGNTCGKKRGGDCDDLDATCCTSHADNAEARQGNHSRDFLKRARARLRSAFGLHGARTDEEFWFGNEPLTSRDRSVPAIRRRLLQDP